MLRTALAAAVLGTMTTSLAAQEASRGVILAGGLDGLSSSSHVGCLETLDKQKALYSDIRKKSVLTFPGFDLISEGIRLRCEAQRLKQEAARLEGERERLLGEAVRLDRLWEEATHDRPGTFRDFAGRDHSQKQLRSDADTVDGTSRTLIRVSGLLESESQRILLLASKTVDMLTEAEAKKIRTALDAESQNDILSRLLGTRPAKEDDKS